MRELEKVKMHRRGGAVTRFHTCTRLQPESNAQHTFGVLCILQGMYTINDEQMPISVMAHVLGHDVPEWFTGDIPAPIKADPLIRSGVDHLEERIFLEAGIPQKKSLTERHGQLVKLADMLDALMSCTEEYDRGNRSEYFMEIRATYFTYIEMYIKDVKYNALAKEILDACQR